MFSLLKKRMCSHEKLPGENRIDFFCFPNGFVTTTFDEPLFDDGYYKSWITLMSSYLDFGHNIVVIQWAFDDNNIDYFTNLGINDVWSIPDSGLYIGDLLYLNSSMGEEKIKHILLKLISTSEPRYFFSTSDSFEEVKRTILPNALLESRPLIENNSLVFTLIK